MRILTLVCFAICLPCTVVATAEALTEDRIAALVRDLGADEYDVRMRAVSALFTIGEPAREAIEEAVKSTDLEIRHLARSVLADLNRGIRPSWPEELIKLTRNYDELPEEKRLEVIEQLVARLRLDAVPFLISCLAADHPQEAESALLHLDELADKKTWLRVIKVLGKPAGPYQTRALVIASLREGTLDQFIEVLSTEGLNESMRNQLTDETVTLLVDGVKRNDYTSIGRTAPVLARIAPNVARFPDLQALSEASSGRAEAAKALTEKALALSPESEWEHYRAAEMLQDLGRADLAMCEWERVLEIPPKDDTNDMNAHLGLAKIRTKLRRYGQAADHYAEMLRLYRQAREGGDINLVLLGDGEEKIEQEIAKLRELEKNEPR